MDDKGNMLRCSQLLRPDGSAVPEIWTIFQVGEIVEVKGRTFKIGWVGEDGVLLERVKIDAVIDRRCEATAAHHQLFGQLCPPLVWRSDHDCFDCRSWSHCVEELDCFFPEFAQYCDWFIPAGGDQ